MLESAPLDDQQMLVCVGRAHENAARVVLGHGFPVSGRYVSGVDGRRRESGKTVKRCSIRDPSADWQAASFRAGVHPRAAAMKTAGDRDPLLTTDTCRSTDAWSRPLITRRDAGHFAIAQAGGGPKTRSQKPATEGLRRAAGPPAPVARVSRRTT
jgi:hypothetical protein